MRLQFKFSPIQCLKQHCIKQLRCPKSVSKETMKEDSPVQKRAKHLLFYIFKDGVYFTDFEYVCLLLAVTMFFLGMTNGTYASFVYLLTDTATGSNSFPHHPFDIFICIIEICWGWEECHGISNPSSPELLFT